MLRLPLFVAVALLAGERAGLAHQLADAQMQFYNGRYDVTAALAAPLCTADAEALAGCELGSSALLFQLKRTLPERGDKRKALRECVPCPQLLSAFFRETERGQATARAMLAADATNEAALFFLGKLDLNYVWLQLGPLGRKTGWDEYWEARRSLDALLKRNPAHVRARVARGWIDYIVDTRMPMGTRWILGGGSRRRALVAMGDAAKAEADFFTAAEARFALWDLHVREKNLAAAVSVARALALDFPENADLARFLETHGR